jgi:hypothetical protein
MTTASVCIQRTFLRTDPLADSTLMNPLKVLIYVTVPCLSLSILRNWTSVTAAKLVRWGRTAFCPPSADMVTF